MYRSSCFIGLCLLFNISLSACALHEGENPSALQPGSVATIAGEPIAQQEWAWELAFKGISEESLLRLQPVQRELFRRRLVKAMVADRILLKDATAAGVAAGQAEVQQALLSAATRYGGDEQLKKFLSNIGLPQRKFDKMIEDRLVLQNYGEILVAQSGGAISPGEEELRAAFNEYHNYFVPPERLSARHILLRLPDNASTSETRDVQAKSEVIRKELLRGRDFAELAREKSECPSSRVGGDLGVFSRGQMAKSFEEVAFSLTPGEISKPVRTSFGYHIILVERKLPAQNKSFEDVRDQVAEFIRDRRRADALEARMLQLWHTADVIIPANSIS